MKLSTVVKQTNNRSKKSLLGYYEGFYDKILSNESAVNLLEIGIKNGHSLVLWENYFPEGSKIVGGDISKSLITQKFRKDTRVIIGDMYTFNAVNRFEDNYFDIIIDDGPHTKDSWDFLIEHYYSKIKPGGKLIIEDIIFTSYITNLVNLAESVGYKNIATYDMMPWVVDKRFKTRFLNEDGLANMIMEK